MDKELEKFLQPAIKVRRKLHIRDPDVEPKERPFKLIQQFLEKLAAKSPGQITCFFGRPFNFPEEVGCQCQHLYITNTDGAIYIGTIFNDRAMDCYPRYLTEEEARDLKRKRRNKELRHLPSPHNPYIIVPSETRAINNVVRYQIIQKYFLNFCKVKGSKIPELANVALCFLSPEKGEEWDKRIFKAVRHKA